MAQLAPPEEREELEAKKNALVLKAGGMQGMLGPPPKKKKA